MAERLRGHEHFTVWTARCCVCNLLCR